MGIHPNIIRAWSSATVNLRRHFVVRQSSSEQVMSTTGFVEGCGLSVVSMVLINTLIHAYLQCKHPTAIFTTYVDNYELQSDSVAQTSAALQSLQGFCSLLDIQLDAKKTVRWACTPDGRQQLRDGNERPIEAARDLGAHMQFNAKQTNATVVAKFKQLPTLWHQLARSHAPYQQKLKILRVVAWPRAMYAVSTVHIGNAHFVEARAGAMSALGLTKSGANPQIHLSLTCSTLSDPEYYSIWTTVSQFRRHMHPELVDATLAPSATIAPRKRKPGPGGVLLSRLEQLCWTYVKDGIFHDGEGGTIHIMDTPIQELRQRLSRAWHHMTGRRWESRKGFESLRYVSVELSRPDTSLAPDELGFIRTAQNGTFFTNDSLIHSGVVETECCKFCQQNDSIKHRHWECEHTAASRAAIPLNVLNDILASPPCMQEHGWVPEPVEIRRYKQLLSEVPDTLQKCIPLPDQDHYDFFCDGTGKDPSMPLVRLVAWGLVLAGVHPTAPHCAVAWGGVPGQWQTVTRAELFAFVAAVLHAARLWSIRRATSAVWSDCEFIIKRARAIQAGSFDIQPTTPDHDMWTVVTQLMPPADVFTLHHIKSHQNYQDSDAWVQWACSANDMADQTALMALMSLPSDILEAQQQARSQYIRAREMCYHLHQHIIRVGRLSVAQKEVCEAAPERNLDMTAVVDWHAVSHAVADRAPAKLKFDGLNKVMAWCAWVHDPQAPVRWISWYEMLFTFQIHSQEWGIESTSSHNTWRIYSKMSEYDCKQTCRSWAAYMLQIIRLIYPDYKAEHNRPSNNRFTCWLMGARMQMSAQAVTALHEWLTQQLGTAAVAKVTTLQKLPVATLEMETEEKPSHGLHRFWTRS